jgi:hypothetical protein
VLIAARLKKPLVQTLRFANCSAEKPSRHLDFAAVAKAGWVSATHFSDRSPTERRKIQKPHELYRNNAIAAWRTRC